MPVEYRALIFIFIIVAIPLALFPRFAGYYSLKKEAQTWSIMWIVTTVTAFVIPNFWLFITVVGVMLIALTKNKPIYKIAAFFVLLPSMPTATVFIPGFGIVNYVMSVNFQMFLTVLLLAPLAIGKKSSNRALKTSELLLYTFFALTIISQYQATSFIHQGQVIIRDSSLTEVMRHAMSWGLIMIVPYLAISKTVKTTNDFKIIFMAIVFGIFLQACIGIAETLKGWHLYRVLNITMEMMGGTIIYLSRADMLRASASFAHPIVMGLTVAFGFGTLLYFYIDKIRNAKLMYWAVLGVFVLGLVASLSRGPWVGAALMVLTFIYTGDKFFQKFNKLALAGVFSLVILSILPGGQRIVNLIPYFDTSTESHAVSTISYRERLMEQSIKVIKKNPIFGSANYLQDPEMEKMRQGEGIIDMVNSYLAIALELGLFGLGIYLAIFVFILIKVKKSLTVLAKYPDYKEMWLQGRVLFAVLVGMLFIAFTTGRGDTSNYYTWSLVGLCIAYVNMYQREIISYYTRRTQMAE